MAEGLADEVCRPRYRKCTPSGRKQGQRCVVSPVEESSCVTGVGTPPFAETRNKGPVNAGANTITPWAFQVPPRPTGASQITCADPPAAGTFFSFPSAKKPTHLPSGDQKGRAPFSVPASSCAVSEFEGRIQRRLLPSTGWTENTRRVPSGENAATPPTNAVPSGGKMLERKEGASFTGRRK